MAVTKIKPIKRTHREVLTYILNDEKTRFSSSEQDSALHYITNDEKTLDGHLVTGYNCTPAFSAVEFAMTQELALEMKGNYTKVGGADVRAYHLIQSFSPEDSISPEQAHEIGKQLMTEFLGGEYEYVIATHIDQAHIHNHIVYNATSFYSQKKFRSQPYKTAGQIRAISDKLCAEHNLHVLPEKQILHGNYQQYQKYRHQITYRVQIRRRLNFLLERETDFDSFLQHAKELGLTINLSRQHVTYRFGAQVNNTRDDKLSDDGRFTRDGLIERLQVNKGQFQFLKKAIQESYQMTSTQKEFISQLRQKYSISTRKNRSGELVYHLNDTDQTQIKESVLGPTFSVDHMIEQRKHGQPLIDVPSTKSLIKQFDEMVSTDTTTSETKVLLSNNFIDKKTADGILLSIDDEKSVGKLVIDSQHIEFLPDKNQYKLYIGDQFNYYFMKDGEQTNRFLKGEQVVRQLELKMGVPMIQLDIPAENILSLSQKGVALQFPDQEIKRLFIPDEFVSVDPLSQRVTISISNNWNYYFQKIPKDENKKRKRIPYIGLKGKQLVRLVESVTSQLEPSLLRQLNAYQRKVSVAEAQKLAGHLSLLRQNRIHDLPTLANQIISLSNQILQTEKSVEQLKIKIGEYNQVAKYLIAYHSYQPLASEIESSGNRKNKLEKVHREALDKFRVAAIQLEARNIGTSVDPEKVLQLVKENQLQEAALTKDLKEQREKLIHFQDVQKLFTQFERQTEQHKLHRRKQEKEK